jgi:long-chain acyl-CoA synthetase
MYEYVTQPLHRALQKHPDRAMTIFGERTRSVRESVDRIARLAAGLRKLGLQAGDRVGMLALNSDRYLEYFFAVPWAGGVVNPCNTRWSIEEVLYSLDDCQTTVLLVDDQFKDVGSTLRERSKSLRHIVYAGDGPTPAGMIACEALIAESAPIPDVRRGGDELLGVFYTGGTTGFPKGVMISHRSFVASSTALIGEGLCPRNGILLRASPMFHLADGAIGFTGVLQDATHVILPGFHPERVFEAIARHKVEAGLLVPTMIQMLISHPAAKTADMSSFKRLVYGASPIAEQTVVDLMKLWPKVELIQAYGQTEMAPAVSVLGAEHHSEAGRAAGLLRSCGRAVTCVEVAIIDVNGTEVPRGTVGEIAVRGPNMMRGYWNKPEQTRAAMPGDGWLRTGDGAYMDERGFIFIVDRMKDMIVTGGENVFSAEVENAISSHPAVAMCAVIGIPSKEWGEAVHAVVVLGAAEGVAEADIIAHCKRRIAAYKCPKTVEFCTALPISGAGKILKAKLREPHWKNQERRVA